MRYNDEQSVKTKLGIVSWRDLSSENFKKLVSMMSEMSDEVKLKIIEQIPHFTRLCKVWLDTAKEMFRTVLDKNEKSTATIIEKIDAIRECISKELDRDNLSSDDRKFIIEQLMNIAEIYDGIDARNKKFHETVFGKVIIGLGAVLGILLALAGGGKSSQSSNEDA